MAQILAFLSIAATGQSSFHFEEKKVLHLSGELIPGQKQMNPLQGVAKYPLTKKLKQHTRLVADK